MLVIHLDVILSSTAHAVADQQCSNGTSQRQWPPQQGEALYETTTTDPNCQDLNLTAHALDAW